MTFAAPWSTKEWWVVGFALHDGNWQRVQEEIVDEEPTPAERGNGLALRWADDVTLRGGRWNDPLELVNRRTNTWTESGAAYWGLAHVFATATGTELGTEVVTIAVAQDYSVAPDAQIRLPLALGGAVPAIGPGTYSIVACVPELALASPVGTLRVVDDGRATDVHVITYAANGTSMGALVGGTLAVKNGCLGLGEAGSHFTYLMLPNGYAAVRRGDHKVLIGPTGDQVAALGQPASFGGGFVPIGGSSLPGIDVPEACRTGGAYFLAGGGA